MITLTCERQHVQYATPVIFNYVNLWRLSQLNNVKGMDARSGEYLTVRLINCLLAEVELLFAKKLLNTKGPKINLVMSHAQGIAFYRLLLLLPMPATEAYLHMIRNNWIEIIDQQILKL